MESKLIFTAEEKSFIIEAEGKKLRVSYDEFCGNHEEVMEFCKKQGGGDETVENLRFIARYRNAINEELKKLDKQTILGLFWANEIAWWSDDYAFVVTTHTGRVYYDYRVSISYARAVSAL